MPIKVCLISLFDTWHAFGIRILSSVLARSGHDASIIFYKNSSDKFKQPTKEEENELIRLIQKQRPDLVGISITSPVFQIAIQLAKRIRKLGVPVVFGGKHPTICPEDSINYADIICIGDGEEALVELANRMDKRGDTTDIKNLWIKKDGKVIRNDMRPVMRDLDSLPFPDYSDENKYAVRAKPAVASERTIYRTMTSRGCPFSCTYCCNHVLSKIYKEKGPYLRRRSVANVIEELVQAKRSFNSLRYIGFADDVFTFDKTWVERFCVEYKKHINLPFMIIVHPNSVDAKIMSLLKDAGLTRVDMGIQSGSERIRKYIFRRYTSTSQIIKAAKMFRALNLEVSCDLIVENPYESELDKRETLDLMLAVRPSLLSLFPLTYFPKTDLTEKALRENTISPSNIEGSVIHDWRSWRRNLSENWQITMDKRSGVFWSALYRLTAIDVVPSIFIRLLSNSMIMRQHPMVLDKIASFMERIRHGRLDGIIRRIRRMPVPYSLIE